MVDENKPNDESDDSGAGSGGSGNDDNDTNLAPTFKLKKDGKVVPMSNREVQDYLDEVGEKEAKIEEKDRGASEKFRKADHALKLRDTMLKVRSDDSQVALVALQTLERDFPESGITGEMVKQAEAQVRTMGGDTKGSGDTVAEDPGPIRTDELDDELQADIKGLREDRVRRRTGVIINKLKEELDKDPDIGDIMNDESLARVSKRVRNEALGVLQRKAGEHARQNPGKRSSWSPKPVDFREAVQEARVFLMDLGYLEDSDNKDSETKREDALPVPTSGRSPSAHSPGSQRRSKEPLKRPSAENSAEYEAYMAEKLARGISST